jgi:hypothetical protein
MVRDGRTGSRPRSRQEHGPAYHHLFVSLRTIGSALISQGAAAQIAGGRVSPRFTSTSAEVPLFANSVVTWERADLEGVALSSTADHDSTFPYGLVDVSAAFDADAGTFSADFDSHIGLDAQYGIWHELFNALTVQVYVKGHTGTDWHARVLGDGQLDASRFGGLPGSLQPLNGTSIASFMDSRPRSTSPGGLDPVDELKVYSGNSTTEITVGADVHCTRERVQRRRASRAICILGA